jgi:hypothetical protein
MPNRPISPELLQQIGEAIRSTRYGTVQITIHDAQVVQIDKIERVRLSATTDLTTGRSSHTAPDDRSSGVSRPTPHGP